MRLKAKHVSDLIKRRLKFLGMTQLDLSINMGWNTNNGQYVSNIVRGTCPFPPKSVYRLAQSLKIEPSVVVSAMTMDYCEALNLEIIKQEPPCESLKEVHVIQS